MSAKVSLAHGWVPNWSGVRSIRPQVDQSGTRFGAPRHHGSGPNLTVRGLQSDSLPIIAVFGTNYLEQYWRLMQA